MHRSTTLMRAQTLFIAFFVFLPWAYGGTLMGIIGDAGSKGPEMDRLKASLVLENVKSLILPGDNLYKGTYPDTWDSWKKAGLQFDVVAIGNHNESYAAEIQYFQAPGEFFSTVKNGARFLVLNSDNKKNVNQQFEWLEREMQSVTEELVFLVYHHPTFTVSKDHNWKERFDFQRKMRQFLKQHGPRISALLLGHDHISTFVQFGDVPAVVAGSGRSAREAQPVSYVEEGFLVQSQFVAPKTQHWALLEIEDNAKEAWIHLVRVSDQKRVCSAHLVAGRMRLGPGCGL